MKNPLVSIICICYNHQEFVVETIQSVRQQSYQPIQLIIVDDGSKDQSPALIRKTIQEDPSVHFIPLEKNSGITRAFNTGLQYATGDFLIDLAADDVLLPERVETGVSAFSGLDENWGVHFTNAEYMDEQNHRIKYHFPVDRTGKTNVKVPEGWIFPELLSRYFICAPTMMFRRTVIEHLGGYDEKLLYEDFDFWVRTSKKFRYIFTNQVLVKKRILKDSLSASQYKRNSLFLDSTLMVCEKAAKLIDSNTDRAALLKRVRYEFRKALFSGNLMAASGLLKLFKKNKGNLPEYVMYYFFLKGGKLVYLLLPK